MYKCYLMLDDYVNSYKNITQYIEKRNVQNIKLGSEIILSLYDIILNNNYNQKINETKYFIMNNIKDKELQEIYKQLVEAYNSRDYKKCLILVDKCEEISRRKNILVEFCTLKKLLNQVNIITNKNRLLTSYEDLKNALKNNDYNEIIQILINIPKFHIQNDELVYSSFYSLIKNNYIEESQQILDTFIKTNSNKLILNSLQKIINEQVNYNKLSEDEKNSYQVAIEKGYTYYEEGNIEYAYYMYTFGEYTTNNNIFNYYKGKMLYKLGRIEKALIYFEEYVKNGSDKLAKAYLYMASIYNVKKNYKRAIYYNNMSSNLDKIFATGYEIIPYCDKNEEEDLLKLKLQKMSYMYKDYHEIFGMEEENKVKLK